MNNHGLNSALYYFLPDIVKELTQSNHIQFNITSVQAMFVVYSSVRPKLGFGIGNRNQDQVSVSVSGPELFLPKPKLSPILKSTKNSVQ